MNKNLEYIIGKAIIKPVKFNSLDKDKLYLKSEGYKYKQNYSHKEDRSMLWKNKFGWVKLYSTKDYLNDTTMEQGTVWNIIKL